MTGEEYSKLLSEFPNVQLTRPFWDYEDYHAQKWIEKDVTVLICQRKTKELIQLCLESLLNFYPDIPVLVVDGDSNDDSTLYLLYKSIVCDNLKVWQRSGINSHGITMHEAIMNYINTNYVLLMDSDVISLRHGYIEGMMQQFENNINLYATGTRMLVTRKNYACGVPEDINDVLKYAHPSCSIYHVPTYKQMKPFVDHGAPCVYNMLDAEAKKFDIGYFPIQKYAAHLSGASWQKVKTIWERDFDTKIRPFITFIVYKPEHILFLSLQTDYDFDMITLGREIIDEFAMFTKGRIQINNKLYDIRFKVTGEYVCYLPETVETIDNNIVNIIKSEIIKQKAPDELFVGGLKIVKRQFWQENYSIL